MQSKAKTVDEYLAEVPAARRAALATLRKLIRATAPKAEETMQYGMPTYMLGEMYCALASQKNYMSLYCCGDVVGKYLAKLGGLKCGRSCIRFQKLDDLPMDTIAAILRDGAKLLKKSAK